MVVSGAGLRDFILKLIHVPPDGHANFDADKLPGSRAQWSEPMPTLRNCTANIKIAFGQLNKKVGVRQGSFFSAESVERTPVPLSSSQK